MCVLVQLMFMLVTTLNRKKLNITNGFPCRCQRVFCAKHRHPELHACTFDYKEEGRRLLEKANPVITFPKLPKI